MAHSISWVRPSSLSSIHFNFHLCIQLPIIFELGKFSYTVWHPHFSIHAENGCHCYWCSRYYYQCTIHILLDSHLLCFSIQLSCVCCLSYKNEGKLNVYIYEICVNRSIIAMNNWRLRQRQCCWWEQERWRWWCSSVSMSLADASHNRHIKI